MNDTTHKAGSATGTGAQPFTRADLERDQEGVLNQGRWGNADIRTIRVGDTLWAVKDFAGRATIVRITWGVFIVQRELSALQKLAGLEGFPLDAFRVDRFALAYRYVEGTTLPRAEPELLTPQFFESLEQLTKSMHARGVSHLDLRYRQNVLVTPQGTPVVIDFQSYIGLNGLPHWIRTWLQNIDLAGVYKHWFVRHPDSLGQERMALLEKLNRKRRLWFLKGYAGFAPARRSKNQRSQNEGE